MLFGNDSGGEVELASLEGEVNALFDKKLEKFSARASKISDGIARAREEFMRACDELEKVSDQPDIEFKMWLNPNFVKNQKHSYVTALKRSFSGFEKPSGATSYSRYSAELASLNSCIREMLGVNSKNKDVINAYSKHLWRFKRLQNELENLAASLRVELERASREYNEYNEITGELTGLRALCEEIGACESELYELQSGGESGASGDTTEMGATLTSMRAELATINGSMERISSGITSLVLPLEKAARIYDHSSMKKLKLAEIVERPEEELTSREGFAKFSQLLEELKDSIEKKRIEVKKPNETLALISRIRNANVYEELAKLELLKKEAGTKSDEIRFFESEIARIKSEAEKSEAAVKRRASLQDEIKRLEVSRDKAKASLEQLIMRHYKRKILVIL